MPGNSKACNYHIFYIFQARAMLLAVNHRLICHDVHACTCCALLAAQSTLMMLHCLSKGCCSRVTARGWWPLRRLSWWHRQFQMWKLLSACLNLTVGFLPRDNMFHASLGLSNMAYVYIPQEQRRCSEAQCFLRWTAPIMPQRIRLLWDDALLKHHLTTVWVD
jgi:hypothetical protein